MKVRIMDVISPGYIQSWASVKSVMNEHFLRMEGEYTFIDVIKCMRRPKSSYHAFLSNKSRSKEAWEGSHRLAQFKYSE